MKTLIYKTLTILLLLSNLASCQEAKNVKVTVVEEDGTPIEKASVSIHYIAYQSENSTRFYGETDAEGKFQATDQAILRILVRVNKEGYYETDMGKLSRTQNHDITCVLRKKIKPIALYAKKSRIIAPVTNKDLGYDFELRDWVAPHGKGKSIDVLFNVHYDERSNKDYDYSLTIKFPNALDGIQEFSDTRLSALKSKHEAPLTGYLKSWLQKTQRRPDIGRTGNRDQNRNYWIRIRSKADGNGELLSAHYIKMYGDFPDQKCYLTKDEKFIYSLFDRFFFL